MKGLEQQINRQVKLDKQANHEETEMEKVRMLEELSKKRLKYLRSIAIRFPKLNNIEENVKFKAAIKELYEEADLSKYYKDHT